MKPALASENEVVYCVTVTVSGAEVTPWNAAVTAEVPAAMPVTSPREPFALETVATLEVPERHVTTPLKSRLVESA